MPSVLALIVFRLLVYDYPQGPELVQSLQGVIHITINEKNHWTVDLKNGKGSVTVGLVGNPDLTISLSDDDFADIAEAKSSVSRVSQWLCSS